MWYGVVVMQVVILLVVFFVKFYFCYMCVKYVEMFFMLGIVDNFVDVWCQNVYCCDGFIVFVKVYIECFNVFWVVFYYYWCFEVFFGQVMFVFRGEIYVLVYWVFELFVVVFQNGDGVGVIYLGKISGDKVLQMVDSVFIYVFGEELYVVCMFFQYCFEDVFEYCFCQVGNVVQVGEGYFWFQYLEFCQVVVGVGVFGVEGWVEGINF